MGVAPAGIGLSQTPGPEGSMETSDIITRGPALSKEETSNTMSIRIGWGHRSRYVREDCAVAEQGFEVGVVNGKRTYRPNRPSPNDFESSRPQASITGSTSV